MRRGLGNAFNGLPNSGNIVPFGRRSRVPREQQVMHERGVVTLRVMHGAAHARVAFAKEQVIGRDYPWGLALRPAPPVAFPKNDSILILDGHTGFSG